MQDSRAVSRQIGRKLQVCVGSSNLTWLRRSELSKKKLCALESVKAPPKPRMVYGSRKAGIGEAGGERRTRVHVRACVCPPHRTCSVCVRLSVTVRLQQAVGVVQFSGVLGVRRSAVFSADWMT